MGVHTVIVRAWLPDRPGALGQVASRIGAVRGDVCAIEILEQGAGTVIDELVVRLPSPDLVDLMVAEVAAVDGVSVEHVRSVEGEFADPDLAALAEVASQAETAPDDRPDHLVAAVSRLTGADWVVLCSRRRVVASIGNAPSSDWVWALHDGSTHLGSDTDGSGDDVSVVVGTELVLMASRPGRPFHSRERSRIELMARIAGALMPSGATGDIVSAASLG